MSSAAPPDVDYFLDRMLSGSRKIADVLKASGLRVHAIQDHHDVPKTSDATWLTTVGRQGWIAISRDRDIDRSPLTIEAVKLSKARMFCLTPDGLKAESICDLLIKAHPVMQEIARRYQGPFIATVGRSADIRFIRGGTPDVAFAPNSQQKVLHHKRF